MKWVVGMLASVLVLGAVLALLVSVGAVSP